MVADRERKPGERIVRPPARIHFLKRDNIRRPFADDRADPVEIECRIEVEGAVDVPRHDPERAGHVCSLVSRVTSDCTTRQNATHSTRTRPNSSTFDHEAFLASSTNCDPKIACARFPGAMPIAVPMAK